MTKSDSIIQEEISDDMSASDGQSPAIDAGESDAAAPVSAGPSIDAVATRDDADAGTAEEAQASDFDAGDVVEVEHVASLDLADDEGAAGGGDGDSDAPVVAGAVQAADDDRSAAAGDQDEGQGEDRDEREGEDETTSLPSQPASSSGILATIGDLQRSSPLEVELVEETHAVPNVSAKAPEYPKMISSMRSALGSAGVTLTDADLLRACKARVVRPGSGKQRKLPQFASPTALEVQLWRDGRSIEQLMGDALKGVRNDGGVLGPERKFERIAVEAGADAAAAKAIAQRILSEMEHRIFEIRVNVAATLNEIRRDRAVLDGLNPASIKYFKVVGD